MSLARPMTRKSEVTLSELVPGDLIASGLTFQAGNVSTVGAGTWTGSAIATGLINRTGPTAGFTDTTDTSDNIIAALTGNSNAVEALNGTAFELLCQNTVAFALTFAAGAGVTPGSGNLNIAASSCRMYLGTIFNSTRLVTMNSTFVTASNAISFVLPPGLVAFKIGPDPASVKITPGMLVTGTGIVAGTTVAGLTMGQGGIVGVTLSANTNANSAPAGNVLTFMPNIRFDALWSSTL